MKAQHACIPCSLKQVERVARLVGCSPEENSQLQEEMLAQLDGIDMDISPAEIAFRVYHQLSEATGIVDPYREVKQQSTRQALSYYDFLKAQVLAARDPLAMAIKVAAAGNMIDFASNPDYDLQRDLVPALQEPFGIFDYQTFRSHLDQAEEVLMIGDNAGETVFDRVLIETLDKPVVYAVRGEPIINDAVLRDAQEAGLHEVASLVSSGTGCPGAVLPTCTPEFRELFDQAEMVISKGQGNYEALSDQTRSIFFVLKVKCELAADHVGSPLGSLVLKGINT
jgi:damage-control phosphatase, subfamily I